MLTTNVSRTGELVQWHRNVKWRAGALEKSFKVNVPSKHGIQSYNVKISQFFYSSLYGLSH